MSTRNPQSASAGKKLGETTEFHLHKSQIGRGDLSNLFDFTEHRLKLYIATLEDKKLMLSMQEILESYKKGLLAVAWRSGKPVWIKVTKETKG